MQPLPQFVMQPTESNIEMFMIGKINVRLPNGNLKIKYIEKTFFQIFPFGNIHVLSNTFRFLNLFVSASA